MEPPCLFANGGLLSYSGRTIAFRRATFLALRTLVTVFDGTLSTGVELPTRIRGEAATSTPSERRPRSDGKRISNGVLITPVTEVSLEACNFPQHPAASSTIRSENGGFYGGLADDRMYLLCVLMCLGRHSLRQCARPPAAPRAATSRSTTWWSAGTKARTSHRRCCTPSPTPPWRTWSSPTTRPCSLPTTTLTTNTPDVTEPSPTAKARTAAHTAKGKAEAEADLAFKLHQPGW